ncbi:DUF6542 domain-containing protein [Corynebacterium auris]|uniref:DUF6542 domain-containing protein n=1 Tax=Corynebacterium auris TaxID=44750 RepID=UPI0025B35103|nr:DUF6542 domain-containing protein [Corynebacterium auris]WJY67728.1 hypothetical protein CAURIS_04060 [Corynebacterium auris]
MSHPSSRTSHAQRATFVGLPTGSGIAIIFAAVFTGALISIYAEQIGWPFLVLFAAGSVLVATLVNVKGLALTVLCAPVFYAAGIVGAGYVIARANTTTEGAGISRTSLLAMAYPLAEFFPVLAAVTVGCAVIAFLRVALIKRHNDRVEKREIRDRSQAAASNRRTTNQSRRARARANSVTVEELMRRRTAPTDAERSPRRRLGEDLYRD